MKNKIHPKYETINVKCSCGNHFKTKSTRCKDLQIDICANCHPYYTGKQRVVDTEGRVENFKKRFGKIPQSL